MLPPPPPPSSPNDLCLPLVIPLTFHNPPTLSCSLCGDYEDLHLESDVTDGAETIALTHKDDLAPRKTSCSATTSATAAASAGSSCSSISPSGTVATTATTTTVGSSNANLAAAGNSNIIRANTGHNPCPCSCHHQPANTAIAVVASSATTTAATTCNNNSVSADVTDGVTPRSSTTITATTNSSNNNTTTATESFSSDSTRAGASNGPDRSANDKHMVLPVGTDFCDNCTLKVSNS